MLKGNQNEIEFRELEKIGFENYFYDITGFNENDVLMLNQLLAYMQKNELVRLGITTDSFKKAATQRDFIEKYVMCNSESIENNYHFFERLLNGDTSFYVDSKNRGVLDELHNIIIDSIYSGEEISEKRFVDLVKEFSTEGPVDLLYEFNRFFCTRYFRSPRVHINTKKNIEDLIHNHEEIRDINLNFYTNMVMAYFAERMALNITNNFKSRIMLYKNSTEVPFITGDTPIICLTGNEMKGMSIFHYPISPRIGVELIITPRFSCFATANENTVIELRQYRTKLLDKKAQK